MRSSRSPRIRTRVPPEPVAFSKPKAHERAERYAAKGQHDKASREYQTIVEHDPKDIRAWLMLADCLVRCGDRPGAIERYTRVAQYYGDAKEFNKALAVYRQVLNLDGQRLDIQVKVAALNLQVGQVPDGIALYERVAHAQLQLGRIGDALATYKIVADADPTAVSRRLRLAELFSREKRVEDAVEAFRQAGEQLRANNRWPDYVRVAERLLYHDGSDLATVRELARAYLQLGDARRALMKLNGLLRSNPADEEGIELLAETFMGLGKPEKALSALEELARSLRAKGPDAKAHTIRILRRGLQWRPGHAEFREALSELEGRRRTGPSPTTTAGGDEDEIDFDTLDEDDLVELDDDDVVMEDVSAPMPVDEPSMPMDLPEAASSAPGNRRTAEVEAIPSLEPSLTQSVLSEVQGDGVPDVDSLTDFDKILYEARVYIKYRLFEHALDHVQTALGQQPQHVGALSLRARALTELGRVPEAAGVHLEVAELVMARDPKLAREHVGAASSLVPSDPRAAQMAEALGGLTTPTGETAQADAPEDEGDSGAFDLVSEGFEDLVSDAVGPAIAPAMGPAPRPPEPAANLEDALADSGEESTQPFAPGDLSAALGSTTPEGNTPPAGFVPARPPDGPSLARRPAIGSQLPLDDSLTPARTGRTLLPFAEEKPHTPSERTLVGNPAEAAGAEATDAGEADDEFDLDLSIESPTDASEELDVDLELEADPELSPEAPAQWVDLSDDLAEVRFYLDQGLEDDAEAAVAELERRHPGHPELRAFRGEPTEPKTTVLVEAEAAAPLIDVEEPEPSSSFDEDEDEDAYLSAIFADPSERESKPAATGGAAGANIAEGQAMDAATAFDLGVAYREMGLVDAAITQFETAATDAPWRARALTMLGTLRVHRGETDQAISDLQEAVGLSSTTDESSEAAYELGVLYEMLGDATAAVAQLQQVAPGYRDRDQRLAQLGV